MALPARRGAPHRRHFRLHGAAASRARREAARVGLPRRQDRQDRRARTRPGDRLLRHAGRARRQADPRRPERVHHEPAQRRRDLRDAASRGRPGAGERSRRGVDRRLPGTPRGDRGGVDELAAPPARLLRGVGRSDDQRDPLGVGAGRRRRRRRRLRRARPDGRRKGSHRARPRRAAAPRARPDRRQLVRQEISRRQRGGPIRLAGRARGRERRAARDQVVRHPAARSGRVDGRPRAAAPPVRRVGPRARRRSSRVRTRTACSGRRSPASCRAGTDRPRCS